MFNSGNLNTYGYCYQNPIVYVDPNGKQNEFHDEYLSPAELTGAAINEVRAAVSNITIRVVSLFTEEDISPKYVVSGSGRLTLVPDMPVESTKEKIVNSVGDVGTIGLALLGGPEGVLFGKAGKSGLILTAGEGKSIVKGAISKNTLNHIFGKSEHALDGLVSKFGSQEKAFKAVQESANQALKSGKLTPNAKGILPSGDNGNIIKAGGMVKDGEVIISPFSRKGL